MRIATACALLALAASAAADEPATPMREAAAHFQRGVQLYNEADYRGALVEFKRANAIAPNPQVVYDIAQTYYQLQDYANSLTMFEQYLAVAPAGAAHRADAQSTLATLKLRVARVAVTTKPDGADVTIDDEPVGTSPLAKPLVVSLGRRKVMATRAGYQPATRYVELAAGDTATVDLVLVETAPVQPLAAAPVAPVEKAAPSKAPAVAAWVVTGLLAVGWGVAGGLAVSAASDLTAARAVYPTTREALDAKAGAAQALAVTADILGAATIVAAVVSIAVTVATLRRGGETVARLGLSPGALVVHGSF